MNYFIFFFLFAQITLAMEDDGDFSWYGNYSDRITNWNQFAWLESELFQQEQPSSLDSEPHCLERPDTSPEFNSPKQAEEFRIDSSTYPVLDAIIAAVLLHKFAKPIGEIENGIIVISDWANFVREVYRIAKRQQPADSKKTFGTYFEIDRKKTKLELYERQKNIFKTRLNKVKLDIAAHLAEF